MDTNRRSDLESPSTRRHLPRDGRLAFTLTELLVVLATLGILAVLLLPALASSTQPGSAKSFQCVNNMRQLGLAWLLYSNDNHDRLVSNSDDSVVPGANKQFNWICPFGVTLDWSASQKNTNTLYLTVNSPVLGVALIGNYVANSVNIFVCPADKYLSAPQRVFAAAGWSSRMRSCSMNGAMGDGSKWFAPGNGGNWPAFYNAKKLTDLHNPGPANCWVIMDEHPDSDDDATFYINPADAASGTSDYKFTELPGSMHNKGSGMVYADGHSEVHVWNGSVDTPPVVYQTYVQNVSVIGDTSALNDLAWLAQHTPQN